jgi:hypothetical protein
MLAQAHDNDGDQPAGRSLVVLHLNASYGPVSQYDAPRQTVQGKMVRRISSVLHIVQA